MVMEEIIQRKFLCFIRTQDINEHHKTYVYAIMNRNVDGIQLGQIAWFPNWRRYTYQTAATHIILDKVCMQQIIEMIDKLEQDRNDRRNSLP